MRLVSIVGDNPILITTFIVFFYVKLGDSDKYVTITSVYGESRIVVESYDSLATFFLDIATPNLTPGIYLVEVGMPFKDTYSETRI